MKSLLAVVRILGGILLVFSVAMLAPLLVAWAGRDGAIEAYARAVAATVGSGLLLWFLTPRKDAELMPRDGLLLVSLVWTVIPLFACLPLLFYFQQAGKPISVTDAYFETVSGLTTTGATVLTGLDGLPTSINFWRCCSQQPSCTRSAQSRSSGWRSRPVFCLTQGIRPRPSKLQRLADRVAKAPAPRGALSTLRVSLYQKSSRLCSRASERGRLSSSLTGATCTAAWVATYCWS